MSIVRQISFSLLMSYRCDSNPILYEILNQDKRIVQKVLDRS